jgi:hypothetical protein
VESASVFDAMVATVTAEPEDLGVRVLPLAVDKAVWERVRRREKCEVARHGVHWDRMLKGRGWDYIEVTYLEKKMRIRFKGARKMDCRTAKRSDIFIWVIKL